MRLLPYGVMFLLLLPVLVPLYSTSIIGSADNLAHLFRIVNLEYALSQGYIWPRWAALEGHGFGAPIFNFNYVLPYYICVLLWRLCGSLLTGSQLYMMLVLAASSWGMYAFLRYFYSKTASILGAIAYVYMPYHLMTVYLYGGYGEALAYVWMPLTCAGIYQLMHDRKFRAVIPTTLSMALLILTHNLSAVMTTGLMMTMVPAFWTDVSMKRRAFERISGVLVGSALLTMWFWLPAVAEQHMTKLGVLFEKETALRGYFFELIAPVWENSYRALRFEAPGYYSYAIGLPAVLMMLLGVCMLGRMVLQNIDASRLRPAVRLGMYFLAWYLVSFFMTRKMSEPLWDLLPARFNFLSYPYRFFFINTFAAAGLTAFVVDHVLSFRKKIVSRTFVVLVVGLFVWQGWIYAHPAIDKFSFGPAYFTYTQTVRSAPFTLKNMGYIEFVPVTADSDFVNGLDSTEQGPRVQIVSGKGTANIVSEKAQDIHIDVSAQTPVTLLANILYFPGWVGTVAGVTVKPAPDDVGRMRFTLPAGNYRLDVTFRNTPVRTFATVVSMVSWICFGLFITNFIVKNRHKIPTRTHSS